jgi:hypothetical protein
MRLQLNLGRQVFSGVLMAVAMLASVGCTQSLMLQPEAEVPVPLAMQLPLAIGVHYPEAFRNYVYAENTEDRPNWAISCGPSQVALFEAVLPSLFSRVVHVDVTSRPDDPELDAILMPEVEEMQFALPNETRTEMYEAWIRYKITMYQPDGQPIVEFPVTGYGKSTTALFKGKDDGLNDAINSAYRDVGAKLTLGFAQVGAVQPWLADKQAESNERDSER